MEVYNLRSYIKPLKEEGSLKHLEMKVKEWPTHSLFPFPLSSLLFFTFSNFVGVFNGKYTLNLSP